MQITNKTHAEIILKAFQSHEAQNEYFGIELEDTEPMTQILELIFTDWPDLKTDKYGHLYSIRGAWPR